MHRALTCTPHVQVSRLMQAQKEQLADERAVILGEHKKELQALVSVMSASVNRDLPARIEGMVAREVRPPPGFTLNPSPCPRATHLLFLLTAVTSHSARTGHSAISRLPQHHSQQG